MKILETTGNGIKEPLRTVCCGAKLLVVFRRNGYTNNGDTYPSYFYCAGCKIACDGNCNVIGKYDQENDSLVQPLPGVRIEEFEPQLREKPPLSSYPLLVKVNSVYDELLLVSQCGQGIILQSREKVRVGMLYGFVRLDDTHTYKILKEKITNALPRL